MSEESETGNYDTSTRIVLLSSNAGFGFVVSFVGQTILGSSLFGFILYFSQISISYIINSFFLFKKESDIENNFEMKSKPLIHSITNSISSSANALISISSYTIFFSILTSLMVKILQIENQPILSTIVYAIFDVTKGVTSASLIKNSSMSFFLIGFSVGFGGISILLQIFTICEPLKINKFKFFLSKFLQGIICGFLSIIFSFLFKFEQKSLPTFDYCTDFPLINVISITIICIFLVKKHINSKILLNCVEFFRKIIYNIKVKYFLGGNYGRK